MTGATELLLPIAMLIYAGAVIGIGGWMLMAPAGWSNAVLRYLRWPPMHPVEIAFCMIFGAVFVMGAEQAAWSWAYRTLGYLLLLVGAGLLLAGRHRHVDFVARITPRMTHWFRPLAIPTIAFGGLLAVGVIT